MADLEKLGAADLAKFAENVVLSWQPRTERIREIGQLRSQNWAVQLPPELKVTLKTQHSSIPHDVSTRAIGILTARDPTFSRTPPDDDEGAAIKANTVARYCQARLDWDKRYALAGRNAWIFLVDQIANKGAGCVGSIFAPHAWAAAPPLTLEDGSYPKSLWRDSQGKPTDNPRQIDDAAVAKAYVKVVDAYRMRARPPIVHRYLPTEQCFPFYVGDQMAAMVIRRKASALELAASGFDTRALPGTGSDTSVERTLELTEVWTRNLARYFAGKDELVHSVYGEGGIVHGYGFVPYEYRIGLPSDTDVEYGPMGLPLLGLIESNVKMIDTLLTFRLNAVEIASFPAWQAIHAPGEINPYDLAANGPKQYRIVPNTVMDFGAGVKVESFFNPGLNKDFDKALEDERAEVRKIIPDVLFGIPASSGYNSAVMTQQARSFFNPMIEAAERLAEGIAVMDMLHISKRLPGPIYMDYAVRKNELSAAPKNVSRISIQASDIAGYYGIEAEIGRELDRVTMGSWAVAMVAAGLMDRQTGAELCGETDFEEMEDRIARDRFMSRPDVQEATEQEAIKQFGLQGYLQQQQAQARIDPTTGLVSMPGGGTAGPGMAQTPEMQGPAGAVLGGTNVNSAGPNLPATNNPGIGLPTPEQPDRFRRRGGAIPGAPQNQGARKVVGFGP